MQRKEMREREEGGKRERDRERERQRKREGEKASAYMYARRTRVCVRERERQLNFLTQAACKRWILLLMTSDHDYIEIMHCNFTVPNPTHECGVLLVVAIFLK